MSENKTTVNITRYNNKAVVSTFNLCDTYNIKLIQIYSWVCELIRNLPESFVKENIFFIKSPIFFFEEVPNTLYNHFLTKDAYFLLLVKYAHVVTNSTLHIEYLQKFKEEEDKIKEEETNKVIKEIHKKYSKQFKEQLKKNNAIKKETLEKLLMKNAGNIAGTLQELLNKFAKVMHHYSDQLEWEYGSGASNYDGFSGEDYKEFFKALSVILSFIYNDKDLDKYVSNKLKIEETLGKEKDYDDEDDDE